MKKVSIIIVTYNSEKDIYDCISSIIEYSDIPLVEIELVVVDNNSTGCDTMFNKLKTLWGEDIVLIKNSSNGGYGQGNNMYKTKLCTSSSCHESRREACVSNI